MITQRSYILLALPLIISTVTTPLLGAVDTAFTSTLLDETYEASSPAVLINESSKGKYRPYSFGQFVCLLY